MGRTVLSSRSADVNDLTVLKDAYFGKAPAESA
jgi:hypothetical protein